MLTYISFSLSVEKWIVKMRTQVVNKTNKEVIQHRTLFFTASTCFSKVSFSKNIHYEAITDSIYPPAIKPITKFWNVICLRVVPSVKIWWQFSAFTSLKSATMLFRFCETTQNLHVSDFNATVSDLMPHFEIW